MTIISIYHFLSWHILKLSIQNDEEKNFPMTDEMLWLNLVWRSCSGTMSKLAVLLEGKKSRSQLWCLVEYKSVEPCLDLRPFMSHSHLPFYDERRWMARLSLILEQTFTYSFTAKALTSISLVSLNHFPVPSLINH